MSDQNADHTLIALQEARAEIDNLRRYVVELEALVAWTRATMQDQVDTLEAANHER